MAQEVAFCRIGDMAKAEALFGNLFEDSNLIGCESAVDESDEVFYKMDRMLKIKTMKWRTMN